MAIQGGQVTPMDPLSELLATLPDMTRRKTAGDGTEPKDYRSPAQNPDGANEQQTPTLDSADDVTLFKTVEQLVRSQDRLARNRWAIDLHFDAVRSGLPFSRLEKVPNVSQWIQKFPNGFSKQSFGATPNKADDLCNKIVDTLLADPPKPDPMRHINEEATREAAALASKILLEDGGEAGTNDPETYRWALGNSLARSASFLHYRVNPSGAGYQPLQKLAHPLATDPKDPLVAQVNGATENAVSPVLRYVTEGGQFTDDASQADRVWLPKIVIERLRREQVRTFPYWLPAERATAVIVVRWLTLAQAIAEWPDSVGQMSSSELQGLASWRPSMGETMAVPYAFIGLSGGGSGPSVDQVGSLAPILQRRMFSYRIYIKACPEYPKGFWADVTGATGGLVLDKGDMEYTVTLPSKGTMTRCRQIPVVQVCPQPDLSGGDPMGWPVLSRFAGASEANQQLYAAFADFCDNMLHPHVFIRSVVAVDEDDWADRTRPIVLGPQDPEPTYERFPAMPPVMEFLQQNSIMMDTASGLTATAQGLDSSNAVSGIAKQLTVRQAQVSMSGFQQNLHAAMTRGWNIKCELIQSDFTVPQLIQYSGEETSDEARWWTGEDFAGIDRVGIQPGTGTMMTPEGKAQYVAFLQTQQWMDPASAADVALPGIRMDLGIPEDPAIAAVERSVAAWLQGPPEGWEQVNQSWQQYQQQQQAAQQAQQAQAAQAAVQAMQPPPPPPPAPPPDPAVLAQHEQALQAQKADQTARLEAQRSAAQQQAEQAAQAQKHQQQMELEQHKAALQVKVEEEKHRMAQIAAEHAAFLGGTLPQGMVGIGTGETPQVVGSPIHHIVEALGRLASAPPPVVHVHVPEAAPIPAAVVHVPAPVVHVAPAAVTVEAAKSERHIPSAVPRKAKKRRGKITGPDGKTYTIESTDAGEGE